jgi:hypothetical protein
LHAGPVFGGAASVEHQNVVADLRGEPQVVRDEHHRGVLALLHLGDEPHDARLDRHVERGGRFVRDDQLRAAREGERDQHALAHAAGELMRIACEQLGAARQMHGLEQFEHALAPLARRDADARQMLVKLRADGQHRIERGERFLRDERDLAAEQRAACFSVHRDQIGAAKDRLPLLTAKPGGKDCATVRPTIDLPVPDSPTNPSTFPGASENERSRITGTCSPSSVADTVRLFATKRLMCAASPSPGRRACDANRRRAH